MSALLKGEVKNLSNHEIIDRMERNLFYIKADVEKAKCLVEDILNNFVYREVSAEKLLFIYKSIGLKSDIVHDYLEKIDEIAEELSVLRDALKI